MDKSLLFYITKTRVILYALYTYVFVFLFSCVSKNEKYLDPLSSSIQIEVKNLEDPKCISTTRNKYFKSFSRIQLESDTNMLIGNIDKLVLNGDRIYIMDSRITHSLFVFDRKGSFINRISRFGQGPEEYMDMRDMFYDPYENTINLVSWAGGNRYKIMSFDQDGNKLIKQIPVDLRFNEVERTNDGLYVFNSKNLMNFPNITANILVYSKTIQKLYEALPILPGWLDRGSSLRSDLFKDKKGNVYCTSDYITDIYRVTPDSLQLYYHYDFGKYNYPDEFKTPENVSKMAQNFQINNFVTGLRDFYESENYVVSCILFQGSYKLIIYDKFLKEVELYELLNNPLASDSFGNFECFSNGYAISSISADFFVQLFENASFFKRKEINELKQQFKRPIKEDDNPILYIYEFVE